MDPLLSKEELSMREKIRGHEFPFNEKAWGAMKTMLDKKSDKPVAGLPTVRHEPVPGPGKRWIPLLLLCMAFGIGAAALLWRLPPTPLTSASAPESTRQINTTLPEGTQYPAPAGASSEKNVRLESAAPAQRVIKQPTAVAAQGLRATKTQAPQETEVGEKPFLLDTRNLPVPLPSALPYPTLQQTARPDSMIQPDKEIADRSSRLEHGILMGLNANAVAAKPYGLSVLPHAGYFVSYRIAPRSSLEVEVIAKYVAGYRMGGHQLAPSSSGSLTDPPEAYDFDLFFLEFPVLFKRHAGSGHAWLLGLKPGLNFPRFALSDTANLNELDTGPQSVRASIKRFDLGLTLGWEWQFARRWALDLRYNQGLTDLSDNLDNARHLNSGLQLSLKARCGKKAQRR